MRCALQKKVKAINRFALQRLSRAVFASAFLFSIVHLQPAKAQVEESIIERVRPFPLPAFQLPAIVPGVAGVFPAILRDGRPKLINFFGSWCVPCIAEHPQLMQLSRYGVPIIGVAVKDEPASLIRFVRQRGNAFVFIGDDREAKLAQSLSIAGFPTSFIVDGQGIVRFRIDGDLQPEDIDVVFRAIASLYLARR